MVICTGLDKPTLNPGHGSPRKSIKPFPFQVLGK